MSEIFLKFQSLIDTGRGVEKLAFSVLYVPDRTAVHAAVRDRTRAELALPDALAGREVDRGDLMPVGSSGEFVGAEVIGQRDRPLRLGRDRLVLDGDAVATDLLGVAHREREHLGVAIALDANGDRIGAPCDRGPARRAGIVRDQRLPLLLAVRAQLD